MLRNLFSAGFIAVFLLLGCDRSTSPATPPGTPVDCIPTNMSGSSWASANALEQALVAALKNKRIVITVTPQSFTPTTSGVKVEGKGTLAQDLDIMNEKQMTTCLVWANLRQSETDKVKQASTGASVRLNGRVTSVGVTTTADLMKSAGIQTSSTAMQVHYQIDDAVFAD